MTIRELISILKKHDPDMAVLVDGYEYGLCDVKEKTIRPIKYRRDVNIGNYCGPHEQVWSHEEGKGETGLVISRADESP